MAYLEQVPCPFNGPHGMNNEIIRFLTGTEVEAEVLATGNGSLATFMGSLDNTPVPRGRLELTYTIGGTTYVATDDCAGFIIGENVDTASSTFDYETCAYSVSFTSALDNGTDLLAKYIYGPPGQDFRLLRYSFAHRTTTDYNIYGCTTEDPIEVTLLQVSDDAAIADGVETNFYIADVTPGTLYVDSCITPFSPRLFYTIGGEEIYVDSHEIQDRRHGNPTADHNILIGDVSMVRTNGTFYGDSNISAATVSWDSDRGITVNFINPPDAGTTVTVKLFIGYTKGEGSSEVMLQSLGATGLDEWVFCTYVGTDGGLSIHASFHISMYYEYNPDPDNTEGMRYDIGYTRNPINWPSARSWISDVVLNVFSNQDRIVIVFETQIGYFQNLHCGYLERPCSREYYPNPCFVSGDQFDPTTIHTDVSQRHTAFFNTQDISDGYGRRWLCAPDNTWKSPDETDRIASSSRHSDDMSTVNIGADEAGRLHLFPIHLWSSYAMGTPTFFGTFNGVFKVYDNALMAYDLITDDDGFTYRIFPDLNRSGWKNFWAVKRES